MGWQELILLGAVLNALGFIALRVLARDKHTANASLVISAGGYIPIYVSILLLLPWLGAVHMQALTTYWYRFALGGLAFALTNIFTYKTLVYFDAAIANIAGSVNALFTVMGAALFLGEDLSFKQVVGATILLLAIAYGVLATYVRKSKTHRQFAKLGVIYALMAGVCYAVAMVNEKSLLEKISIGSYVTFGVGWQLLVMVGMTLIVQRQQLYLLLKPRIAGWTALSGSLRGFGAACVIVTEVKSNNVALAVVISNFRLILVILLGAWLLHESQHLRQKLTAAAAAIAGLTVMFWK